MSTIRVVNIQHTDATEPNIVLEADGTTVFASGITISGGTNLTVSGTAEFASGTVSTPGITFIDDNNTGIYEPAADTVAITTAATERLRIDSTGNVGIGTTSPSSFNSSANQLVVGTGSAAQGLTISTGTTNNGSIYFADGTTGTDDRSGAIIYDHGGDNFRFHTAADERMRIDSSGRLGVGTSSPNNKFTVQDGNILVRSEVTTGSNNLYHIGFSATAAGGIAATIGSAREAANEASALTFNNWNGTAFGERMRIDSSGRLLVGTSSTSAQCSVLIKDNSGSSGPGILRVHSSVDTPVDGATLGLVAFGANNDSPTAWMFGSRDGGTWTAGSSQPTRLVFSTTADGASSPTPNLAIRANGNIHYESSIISSNGVGNSNSAFGIEMGQGFIGQQYPNTSTSGTYFTAFFRGTALIGSITQNGTTQVAYNTSSDYRLKENINEISEAVIDLKNLRPCKFNFISEPDRTIHGFIAHEVQDIVPEAVTGEKDAVNDEGNPVYQGIDQSKLVPLLTAALQEAIAKIETLEASHNDLLARVTALEAS
jgi:hypothetical protein